MKIKEKIKAPLFRLNSTNKYEYSLKNSLGKYVVIYFYPKDDTQVVQLRQMILTSFLSRFKKLNCDLYGISKDTLKSHDKFREKYKIKFDLLSDESLKTIKKYNV